MEEIDLLRPIAYFPLSLLEKSETSTFNDNYMYIVIFYDFVEYTIDILCSIVCYYILFLNLPMTSSLFLPAPLGVRFVLVRSGLKRFAAFLLSSLSWHSFLNFSSTTGLSEFGSISSRSTVESEEQDVGY